MSACDLFCVQNITRPQVLVARCKFSRCQGCSFCGEASNGTTVDVAINVHESPEVIQRQWANVFQMMRGLSPRIVLSCNAAMSRELQTPHWRPPPGLVWVNPEVIEKARYDGTLFQGVVSNLRFLLDSKRSRGSQARYFIILGSRSKMVRAVNEQSLLAALADPVQAFPAARNLEPVHIKRSWPCFNLTRLLRTSPSVELWIGAHEGLVLERETVREMLRVLDSNPTFGTSVYGSPCPAEEWVPHTLARYVGRRTGSLLFPFNRENWTTEYTGRTSSSLYAAVAQVQRTRSNWLNHFVPQ